MTEPSQIDDSNSQFPPFGSMPLASTFFKNQPLKSKPNTIDLYNMNAGEHVDRKAAETKKQVDPKSVRQLLEHVVRGDLESVDKMLSTNKELVYAQGDIVDLSEREFKKITAFQYAFWAIDKPMWELILKYLPKEHAAVQALAFETNRKRHGQHFSFEPVLNKYEHFLMDKLEQQNDDESNKDNNAPQINEDWDRYWRREVGGAQRQFPAWLVFMMCEEGYRSPWMEKFLINPYQRDKKHLNWWFEKDENGYRLGANAAISRGPFPKPFKTPDGASPPADVGLPPEFSPWDDRLVLTMMNNQMRWEMSELKSDVYSSFTSPTALTKPTIDVLLHFLIRANMDQLKQIIGINPDLLDEKGSVTDLGNRYFENVLPAQYAAWLGDTYIQAMTKSRNVSGGHYADHNAMVIPVTTTNSNKSHKRLDAKFEAWKRPADQMSIGSIYRTAKVCLHNHLTGTVTTHSLTGTNNVSHYSFSWNMKPETTPMDEFASGHRRYADTTDLKMTVQTHTITTEWTLYNKYDKSMLVDNKLEAVDVDYRRMHGTKVDDFKRMSGVGRMTSRESEQKFQKTDDDVYEIHRRWPVKATTRDKFCASRDHTPPASLTGSH